MSSRAMANGRQFRFDLTVDIAPGVAVSGGELAELISDGLLALEAKRLLFPGLRPAGDDNWLLGTSIQCNGYARPADLPAVDAAYARLIAPARPRRAKGVEKLVEDLREARDDLGAAILRLRALQARVEGLVEILSVPSPPAAEAAKAAPILQVASAISETVERQLAEVL